MGKNTYMIIQFPFTPGEGFLVTDVIRKIEVHPYKHNKPLGRESYIQRTV